MEAKNLLKQIAQIAGVEFSEEKTETPIVVEQEIKLEEAEPEAESKPDINKMVEDLTARVTSLEDALKQTMSDLAMSKEANVKLNKIVETIANTPISEPLQRTETLELSQINNEDAKYKHFVQKINK